MSKFNKYAKDMDAAFKSARTEYTAAVKKLQAAEQARHIAGADAMTRNLKELEYKAAEKDFWAASDRIWDQFNKTRQQLKNGLEADIKANNSANPDAIDSNALELLKSGIMTPDDYYALLDKYDNNSTMLRLIGKYAQAAADDTTDDRAARGALLQVAQACKDGQGNVMRAWDSISQVADYCSGQAHGRREKPGYVISMGEKWEQLATEAIDNF